MKHPIKTLRALAIVAPMFFASGCFTANLDSNRELWSGFVNEWEKGEVVQLAGTDGKLLSSDDSGNMAEQDLILNFGVPKKVILPVFGLDSFSRQVDGIAREDREKLSKELSLSGGKASDDDSNSMYLRYVFQNSHKSTHGALPKGLCDTAVIKGMRQCFGNSNAVEEDIRLNDKDIVSFARKALNEVSNPQADKKTKLHLSGFFDFT